MLLAWVCATAVADDEVRFAVGGQLETQGHGILDVGYRRGPLSLQLFTDTVDARVTGELDGGRVTVGLRGAAFAAGMWITPWTDGAPDLGRAQRVSYFGPDVEAQRYLPGGLWLGASGWLRPHFFVPLGDATLEVPDTVWGRVQAQLGLWRDDGGVQARLAAGVDATDPGALSQHVFLDVSLDPRDHLWLRWSGAELAPTLDLHLGLADGQDDVTATRVGGMTPYHVPVGGLAWAEVWAEDYAVGRLGGRLSAGAWTARLAADLGTWAVPEASTGRPSEPWALGLEARARWAPEPWFAELALGWAPTWDRPDGVWPVPVYLLIGSAWTPLSGR